MFSTNCERIRKCGAQSPPAICNEFDEWRNAPERGCHVKSVSQQRRDATTFDPALAANG